MKWKPNKKRPLSWSAISSFEYDPEQWYRRYVLGEQDLASKEMVFGKMIGEMLAANDDYLPQVPRGKHYEFELRASFAGIPLIGFIDSYTPHTIGDEYKTGVKVWDQKRADAHGQIDMYTLLLYLMHEVKPEDLLWRLSWLPTKETGDFRIIFTQPHNPVCITFETRRTMKQVLAFGQRIKDRVAAMEVYAKKHA